MQLDYSRLDELPIDQQEELKRSMRVKEVVMPYAILSYTWEGAVNFRPLIPTAQGLAVTRKLLVWARHNDVNVSIQHIRDSDLHVAFDGSSEIERLEHAS